VAVFGIGGTGLSSVMVRGRGAAQVVAVDVAVTVERAEGLGATAWCPGRRAESVAAA